MALTMFDKIWARHVVAEGPGGHTLLYVDRHLLHEGSATAFARLARAGRRVRRPDLACDGGSLRDDLAGRRPTDAGRGWWSRSAPHGGAGDRAIRSGDVGAASSTSSAPSRARRSPGMLLVCGDSHPPPTAPSARWRSASAPARSSTCWPPRRLWQRKPQDMRVTVDGSLGPGVRQGRDPGHHRRHRRRRRRGPRARVRGRGDPRDVDGRAHDRLQHVDRGRRAQRDGRARRDDLRLSRGPPFRAAGRARGSRRWPTGGRCRATPARASTARCASTARDDRADGDLGHEPRGRAADHRPRARPGAIAERAPRRA